MGKILVNRIINENYQQPDTRGIFRLFFLDSLGLHRVQNPSNVEGAVSLHIYSPPFDSCQIFDEATGKKRKCPMTFWSKYGEKVNNVPVSFFFQQLNKDANGVCRF